MANLKIESEDNYGLEFIIFFKLGGVLLCVQIRQICSAGDSPVRVTARNPVA